MPIGSYALAYRMLERDAKNTPEKVTPLVTAENDVPELLKGSTTKLALIAASICLGFLYIHLELDHSIGYFYNPLRLPVLTLLWVGLGTVLLYSYIRQPQEALLMLLTLSLVVVVGKLFFIDLPSWNVHHMVYMGAGYSFRDALLRLIHSARSSESWEERLPSSPAEVSRSRSATCWE